MPLVTRLTTGKKEKNNNQNPANKKSIGGGEGRGGSLTEIF